MMKKLILFLLLQIATHPSAAFAEAVKLDGGYSLKIESPNKISKIQGKIKSAKSGASKLVLSNGVSQKEIVLLEHPFFFKPEVRWFGEDIVQVKVWKTPQKSTSVFYDLIQERKSIDLANVLAVNGNGTLAANVDNERLRIIKIFAMKQTGMYYGDNSISLDAKFPAGRPLLDVIKRAEFTPENDFMMRYEVRAKVQMGVRVSGSQIQF